jgi:hypothetical protein
LLACRDEETPQSVVVSIDPQSDRAYPSCYRWLCPLHQQRGNLLSRTEQGGSAAFSSKYDPIRGTVLWQQLILSELERRLKGLDSNLEAARSTGITALSQRLVKQNEIDLGSMGQNETVGIAFADHKGGGAASNARLKRLAEARDRNV